MSAALRGSTRKFLGRVSMEETRAVDRRFWRKRIAFSTSSTPLSGRDANS